MVHVHPETVRSGQTGKVFFHTDSSAWHASTIRNVDCYLSVE